MSMANPTPQPALTPGTLDSTDLPFPHTANVHQLSLDDLDWCKRVFEANSCSLHQLPSPADSVWRAQTPSGTAIRHVGDRVTARAALVLAAYKELRGIAKATDPQALLAEFRTRTGQVGLQVIEQRLRRGVTTYMYTGKWGAGSGPQLHEVKSRVRTHLAARRGVKQTVNADAYAAA